MKKHAWIVVALVVAALLFAVLPQSPKPTALAQSTNPPSGYTLFAPVCYDDVNGAARLVTPWGTKQGDPNCTPPAAWLKDGPYDGILCSSGGSFDCRKNEFYTELALH